MSTVESTRVFDLPRGAGAAVSAATLAGSWVNYDKGSRGIARLVITADGAAEGSFALRVYGAGSPQPVDWGERRGEAFAAGVAGGDGVGFSVRYDFGFMETFVAAYLNLRLLVVDTYNTFKDGSGRCRYFMRDHFYQVDG